MPDQSKKRKILIVDDEEHIRFLFGEELQEAGYLTMTLDSGYKLLEFIQENKPDLVILDIKMVDFDGLELLQDIRNVFYDLPVILNTAYDTFKEDLKSISADFYVIKSFDCTELKIKVNLALSTYEAVDADPYSLTGQDRASRKIAEIRAYETINENIRRFLNEYFDDRAELESHPAYQKLLADFDENGYLTYFSQNRIDAILQSMSRDFKRDLQNIQSLIEDAQRIGSPDKVNPDMLLNRLRTTNPIISLDRVKMEIDTAAKRYYQEIQELKRHLAQIIEKLDKADYGAVPVISLRAALIAGKMRHIEDSDVLDITTADIRHDFKAKLEKMQFHLQNLSQKYGLQNLTIYSELIRTFQKNEGSIPCFATDRVLSCGEDVCLLRSPCQNTYKALPFTEHITKMAEAHQELLWIKDRLSQISGFVAIPQFKQLNLLELFNNTITELRLIKKFGKKGVSVTCSDEMWISTDPGLLSIAIRQVLQNAVEAIESSVKEGRISVSASVDKDKGDIIIIIEDNGPGIPKDIIEDLFRSKIRYKKEASGMGLPLSRLALSCIGGSITLDSKMKEWTRVEITIPKESSYE